MAIICGMPPLFAVWALWRAGVAHTWCSCIEAAALRALNRPGCVSVVFASVICAAAGTPRLTSPHFQIFQLSIGLAEASLFARLDAAVAFWACRIPDAGTVLCGLCVAITSPAGWKGRKAMLFARLRALSWVDASAHNTTVQLSCVSVVQQVVLSRAPP